MADKQKSQSQRFVDLAKQVEADEGEDAFDYRLKQIANAQLEMKKPSNNKTWPDSK